MIAATIEIEPYVGRVSPKIEGLDSASCSNLAKRLGADFARIIADRPSVLEGFRYSREKRAIIAAACEAEAAAAGKIKTSQKGVLDALLWAGVNKTKARFLSSVFRPKDDPYQFLFTGRQSFKMADRFAQKLDPDGGERERPQAIVIAALRALAENDGNTLATGDEIEKRAYLDFALSRAATGAAIEALQTRGVVTIIEQPKTARDANARHLFGLDPSPSRIFIGLTTLIEAEQRIATFTKDAAAIPGTEAPRPETGTIVEQTIAKAATLLGRPGFVLDEQQSLALRRIFTNRLSIITGPPGSGKTAIAALANLVASKLYPDHPTSIYGVALAGRAASMLHDAASIRSLDFPAATIHRALGLDVDADGLDDPASQRTIDAPVLVIDESSMVNSILLARVLDETSAEHVVLLGDVDQLPPIGGGAPFADMIAAGLAPVTRLERNYRTDLAGIRGLARAIGDGDVDEIGPFVEAGGVAYYEEAFGVDGWKSAAGGRGRGSRGAAAGKLWRDLIKQRGASPHEIAVITPRNVGDEGTAALNRDIRAALDFEGALAVGDLILVTKNQYDAPTPDGKKGVDIFNGERCTVIKRRGDFFDGLFPGASARPKRVVRFLHDGEKPPEGTAYGYALTVHRAQGSQFDHVILVTARPDRFVSRASVYTATSRARKELTIVGDEEELAACARRDEKRRRTFLSTIGASFSKSDRRIAAAHNPKPSSYAKPSADRQERPTMGVLAKPANIDAKARKPGPRPSNGVGEPAKRRARR